MFNMGGVWILDGERYIMVRERRSQIRKDILYHVKECELDSETNEQERGIISSVFYFIYYYFLNFWLCWVFIVVCRLSLVVVSGGYSSLWCAGFSLWWLLLLRSMGSTVQAQ